MELILGIGDVSQFLYQVDLGMRLLIIIKSHWRLVYMLNISTFSMCVENTRLPTPSTICVLIKRQVDNVVVLPHVLLGVGADGYKARTNVLSLDHMHVY